MSKMWQKGVLCVVLTLWLACSGGAVKRYDNYKVYEVVPQTHDQLLALRQLGDTYDFWLESFKLGQPSQIMVPPTKTNEFLVFISNNKFHPTILWEDIQRLIDEEQATRFMNGRADSMEWTVYHNLTEIYAWLDELAASNPKVKTVIGGTTFEGREIRGIEINNGKNLPGVILESGIHAREWIGPAATSWIVNEILNSPSDSTWAKYNYLYFPNLNPDGYEYSWSEDRMWRKTRKPYGECTGADPNRNFDNHWLEGNGASGNPCSETYGGPKPFSEIETKTYADFMRSVSSKYDIYIAFHSAAQLLLFPWGWTPDPAPLHDLWQNFGDRSAAAIEAVNGTKFEVGDIYETIYPASATSMDWYYGEFNSTLSYTYEMRSGYGFTIPPEFIIPCGKEHLAGLLSLLEDYQTLL